VDELGIIFVREIVAPEAILAAAAFLAFCDVLETPPSVVRQRAVVIPRVQFAVVAFIKLALQRKSVFLLYTRLALAVPRPSASS
jgi:hypothetical protein